MDLLVEKLNSLNYNILIGISLAASLLFVKKRLLSGVNYNSTRLINGKTIIITGATSGIGFATALDLAKRGATVILACRDLKKSESVTSYLRKHAGHDQIFYEHIDLASLSSVKQFAANIKDNYKGIDILINNAGIMSCPYQKTEDGFEYQFQVNYLSHYLLTRLLLDKLIDNSPSRIINLTSKLYESGKIDFQELENETKTSYLAINAYKRSKLANILFSNHLEKKLSTRNISNVGVYSVSPGVVLTHLGRYTFNSLGFVKKTLAVAFYPVIWYLLRTPSQGAQTTLLCALKEEFDEKPQSGFYRNCQKTKLLPHACDSEMETKLWDYTENILKKWLE